MISYAKIDYAQGGERRPTPDPRPRYVDVTPSLARKWLSPDINSHNRKIISNAVAFYADAMEHGEWAVTGETIQFAGDIDTAPTLLNGQHRLEAIAQTGITQRILIVDRLDPDVFAVLDTGKSRGFKDVLSAMGEADATKIAAAARLAYNVEQGAVSSKTNGGQSQISNVRLQQWFEAHPDFAKYGNESSALRKAVPINPSAAMVAMWRLHQIDTEAAGVFFTGLRTGANLDTGDGRLAMREWLVRNGGRQRGVVHLAMVFKAWNGWRNNRPVQMLRWNPEAPTREKFPEPSQ